MFNPTPANIIGLVTEKPKTEDYVPLLPWLGVVLLGVALGSLWQRRRWAVAAPIRPMNDKPPRVLQLLGTWALTVYLVHQPLMMGALALVRQLGL